MAQARLIKRLPLPLIPPGLKIGREIDRGAWGVVYEGQLDGQPVAVKKVHEMLVDAEGGDNPVQSFFEECERLKTVDHPHVIKFSGAFKDAQLGPILVMERMNENLRRFLEKRKGKLAIEEQIRISLEITRGVAFLHQLKPPLVHRDLNDKNVMFTFAGVAKIGDFGQSKLKQDLYLTSDQPGMVSFMPPEALGEGTSKYDESLDIFSLGVLLLEIGTQQQPLGSIVGIGVTPEMKRRKKDLKKMGDLHPLKPFILHCLSDRKGRPKAAEMLTVLSSLEVNILQTILAADERFHRMVTDMQAQLRGKAVENQDIQLELDRTKTDMQAQLRGKAVENQGIQLELDRTKTDMQAQLRGKAVENQDIQLELDRTKADVASRDDTIKRLQDWCKQFDARLSRQNEEHVRLREAETQKLQRELAVKQDHEQKIMDDLQVARRNFRTAAEEKQSIQKELDRANTNVAGCDNTIRQLQGRCEQLEADLLGQNEEHARLREAETEGVRRELAEKQKQKRKMKADLQVARGNLTAAIEEKHSIQKELERANVDIAGRDIIIRQLQERCEQLTMDTHMSRQNEEHARLREAEIERVQRELVMKQEQEQIIMADLQVARRNFRAATEEKQSIQKELERANEVLALENSAKNEFLTQMEIQMKSYKNSSNAVQHKMKGKELAEERQVTLEQKVVQMPQARMRSNEGRDGATGISSPLSSREVAKPLSSSRQNLPQVVQIPQARMRSNEGRDGATGISSNSSPLSSQEVPKPLSSSRQNLPQESPTKEELTTSQQVFHKQTNHHSDATLNEPSNEGRVAGVGEARDTKDAPSCEKCGQIFPWNQLHLRWKHKCAESPEDCQQHDTAPSPAPLVVPTPRQLEVGKHKDSRSRNTPPRAPADAAPEAPEDVLLEEASTVLEAPVTSIPEAHAVVRPQPLPVDAPEEPAGTTLKAPEVATPKTTVAAMPKKPTSAMPGPIPLATPEEHVGAMPEAHTVTVAEPISVATPEKPAVATPEEPAVATPEEHAVAMPEEHAVDVPEPIPVATPEERAVATPEERAVATPEERAVATPEERAVATPEERAVATPEERAVATPEERAVATPEERAVATPEERAVATPEEPTIAMREEPTDASKDVTATATHRETTVPMSRAPTVAKSKEPMVSVSKATAGSVPKVPTVDSNAGKQETIKVFTDKEEDYPGQDRESQQHTQTPMSIHHEQMLIDGASEAPDKKDRNMKDAPSCEKCGKVFPWNKLHLKWNHMFKCTGSAESSKNVDVPVRAAVKGKGAVVPKMATIPRSSTISKMEDTKEAAADDLPKCEKCGETFPWDKPHLKWGHKCSGSAVTTAVAKPRPTGVRRKTPTESDTDESRKDDTKAAASKFEEEPTCEKCGITFPWNKLHLRWKHKCEASEETHVPNVPRRRTQSTASRVGRPKSMIARDDLSRSTIEERVKNEGCDKAVQPSPRK